MLGQDLTKILAPEYEVIPWDLAEMDITREKETAEKITKVRPRVIINCAAYTNVDQCETHREQAFLVNAEGTKHVALASNKVQARLVHLSTDYVFDGTASTPYRETDSPNPMSVYGQSKLQGEIYIGQIGGDHLIIRTAWLYGARGKNFVQAILEKAKTTGRLTVVDDQTGSPTCTRDLAAATELLVDKNARGIFHVTNRGWCTWFDFAKKILQEAHLTDVELSPIKTAELERAAKRPAYSVMSGQKFMSITGKTMQPWQLAFSDYFKFITGRTCLSETHIVR